MVYDHLNNVQILNKDLEMGDIYNSTELQNAAEESQSIASFSLTDGVTLE